MRRFTERKLIVDPGHADYTYDFLDRLESTRSFNPATNALLEGADYQYDALDRVAIEKQLHPDTGDRTEIFGYLGLSNLVTSETQTPTSGSATTKTYGFDAWGQRTTMTSKVGTGTTNWYALGSDAHGSTSTLLDITSATPSSAPTASYGYTAYGAADDDLTAGDYDPSDPLEAAGDGLPLSKDNDPANAYRYTAKRLDTGADDGLDMGARRYIPDVARFLQLDYFNGALSDLTLSSDPLTSNRYALAGGNPLSFIEWDGHMAVEATANAGGSPWYDPRVVDAAEESEAGTYVDPLAAVGDWIGAKAQQLARWKDERWTDLDAALHPCDYGRLDPVTCLVIGAEPRRSSADGQNIQIGIVFPIGGFGRAGVTNPVPSRLARVTPGDALRPTLAPPAAADAFVTAAEDIAGLDARALAQRLGIRPSPSYTVVEFDTPYGIASPINRMNPGFVGGGLTSGGAREFVVPNGLLPSGYTHRAVW